MCWLGPWSVTWLSPVRISPKSLLGYIFTEILKKGTILVRTNPKPEDDFRLSTAKDKF